MMMIDDTDHGYDDDDINVHRYINDVLLLLHLCVRTVDGYSPSDGLLTTTTSIIVHALRAKIDQLALYHLLSRYCVDIITQYTRLVKQCSHLNESMYEGGGGGGGIDDEGPNNQQSFRLHLKQLKAHNITINNTLKNNIINFKNSLSTFKTILQQQLPLPPTTTTTKPSTDVCDHESKDIQFALNPNLIKIHQHGPARKFEFKNYVSSVDYLVSMMDDMLLVNETTVSLLSYHTVDSVSAINNLSSISSSSSSSSSSSPLASVLTIDQLITTSVSIHETDPQLMARCYYLSTLYILSPDLSQLLWASMYSSGLPHSMIDSDLVNKKWLCENPTSAAWDLLKGDDDYDNDDCDDRNE